MALMLKNWVVLIKVWKMEAKWKRFQSKHFGEELYTFISIPEIGLLNSCYLCTTWLNWSLKFHAKLWTISYWHSHTTHKSNVQWISISFVLLYMFECDVCVLKLIMVESKRFLIILFSFESDFYHSLFLSFVLILFFNVSSLFLYWKTGVKVFRESFTTWLRVVKLKNAFLAIFGHQAVGFSSSSQVTHELATPKTPSSVFRVLLVQNSLYDSFMTPSFSKPSFSMLLHQNSTNFNCFNSINISKVIFNTFHCF